MGVPLLIVVPGAFVGCIETLVRVDVDPFEMAGSKGVENHVFDVFVGVGVGLRSPPEHKSGFRVVVFGLFDFKDAGAVLRDAPVEILLPRGVWMVLTAMWSAGSPRLCGGRL